MLYRYFLVSFAVIIAVLRCNVCFAQSFSFKHSKKANYVVTLTAENPSINLPKEYINYPVELKLYLFLTEVKGEGLQYQAIVSSLFKDAKRNNEIDVAVNIFDMYFKFQKTLFIERSIFKENVIQISENGLERYNLDLLESIFFEFPKERKQLGDSWQLHGNCGIVTLGVQIFSEGKVHFSQIQKQNGKDIAVMNYEYVTYENKREGKRQVYCSYKGIHKFDLERGIWKSVEGTLEFPSIDRLKDAPRKYNIYLIPTEKNLNEIDLLDDNELTNVIENTTNSYKWPFDFYSEAQRILGQPNAYDTIKNMQNKRFQKH